MVDPQNLRLIDDLDALKVISDPTRFNVFQIISSANQSGKNCTVKMLAKELDLPQTKLYYHINLLEKHDFISVSDTRVVSGIIEKHYQVQAFRIAVSPGLFSEDKDDQYQNMVSNILNSTLAEVQRGISQQKDPEEQLSISLAKKTAWLTAEEFEEISEQLDKLMEKFERKEKRDERGKLCGLTCVLYPINQPMENNKND